MIKRNRKREGKSSRDWQESLTRDLQLMNWETERSWFDSVIMWKWQKHRTTTGERTNHGHDCQQQTRQQFGKSWMNTKVMKWRSMHRANIWQDFTGHRNFLLRRICLYFWYCCWTRIREYWSLSLRFSTGSLDVDVTEGLCSWSLCSTWGQDASPELWRQRSAGLWSGTSCWKDWSEATWKSLLLSFPTCLELVCSLPWKRRCCACTGFTIPRPLT